MKISSFIMFLIVISSIFAIFGLMVSEANKQYTNVIPGYVPIMASNWSGANGWNGQDTSSGPFDFVASINSSVGRLQVKFNQMFNNPDEGFFSKITAGLTAIPYAILLLPDVLVSSIALALTLITAFFTVLNIPAWFIIAGGVMLLVWGVFKLLEFFQRVPL